MTLLAAGRRIGGPLTAAVATALLFTAVLWVQRGRGGWPFDAPPAARPVDPAHATASHPATEANSRGPVDAASTRSLDIRLETVGRETLTETVRAVATIVPDESRISHVHTRVAGWIEHLDVNTTGEVVREGQPLAHIFSQELLSSQTEYLAARRNTAASGITSAVVAGGRTRLSVLADVADAPGSTDLLEQWRQPVAAVPLGELAAVRVVTGPPIAVAGVAAETGIVMVVYLDEAFDRYIREGGFGPRTMWTPRSSRARARG